MDKNQLTKISDVLWQVEKSTRADMLVPARIFATGELLDAMLADRSIEQLINVTTLPGIQQMAMAMPDAHEGYGFPIGGVAATRHPDGAISPGGIGYDINCGVRLLLTDLRFEQVRQKLSHLAKELYHNIPSGVGRGGKIRLDSDTMDRVLKIGARYAVERGLGDERDLEYIESHGCLPDADPRCVSFEAKRRGMDQLGTLGAGNHFVEVDRVQNIFDEEAAEAFGLEKDQIVVLIHTGSRGLGHQVATDYLRTMMKAMPKYGINPPDRELACVPFNSTEGQDYFKAMACAANFAWCNREVITWEVRNSFASVFGKNKTKINILYDVAHNIAKIEEHLIDGKKQKVIVHRKGATRAFGPGIREIPEAYRNVGQPVLIPGSMGTASYVLAGTQKSMETSFGSTCHGAGRRLSRHAAKREVDANHLKNELLEKGIYVEAGSYKGVAEEAPIAYKDVDLVVETVHQAGIAKKVAKLKPVAVIKG